MMSNLTRQSTRRWWAPAAALALIPAAAMADEITLVTVHIHETAVEPYTEINVETAPPINQIMSVIGDPMAATQMMAELQDAAEASMSVSIWLPFIDYGSTGSFSEVNIASNEGRSFDPAHFLATGKERYIGQVTITELTEEDLAGSYSAELFVAEPVDGSPRPRVRGVGSVSGWFRMGLPVMTDDRYELVVLPAEEARAEASALWDGLRMAGLGLDDMDRLGNIESLAHEMQEELGAHQPAAPIPGGGNLGATMPMPCICACEYLAMWPEDAPCRDQCEAQGLVCAADTPGTDPGLDAMIAELQSLGYPPDATAMIRQMLAGASPEERTMMIEMYKQAAPALQN